MVGYPFPVKYPTGSKEIYYKTGQGMGIYSSWTSMAVTHHLLILLAAHRAGYRNFKDYAVLGDDVVIADERVAWRYKDIILRLGLDIRPTKSMIPTKDHIPVEFASKLILNGVNISPLPIGLLINGGIQGILQFLHLTYDQAYHLGGTDQFWSNLRVHGPFPGGKSSSLVSEATSGILNDTVLTLWGFSYFKRKVRNITKDQLSAQRWQISDPLISTLLRRYPIELFEKFKFYSFQATHQLYQQAVARRLTYAFDNTKVKEVIYKSYKRRVLNDIKTLLDTSSEFWILMSSPWLDMQTKVEEGLIEYYIKENPFSVSNSTLTVNLPVLLGHKLPLLPSLTEDLVMELIVLARGPKGLIQIRSLSSKQALTKAWPALGSIFFRSNLLVKFLKRVGILSGFKSARKLLEKDLPLKTKKR
jgi:hypothetical protein